MPDNLSHYSLVVDFVGAPGAGKTFVSQAIANQLRGSGITTLVLREKLFPKRYSREWFASRAGSLLWIARHPRYSLQLQRAIAATRQVQPRDRKRFFTAWVRTCERMERLTSRYQITLVDHGLAQLLWSIGYSAEPSAWDRAIERFRPLLRPSDLTIVVDADAATAMQRLERRARQCGKTSRLQKENLDDERIQARVERLRSQIVDLLKSCDDSGCHLMTFNNDDDNGASIELLGKAIERLVETGMDCPAKFVSGFLEQSAERVLPAGSASE